MCGLQAARLARWAVRQGCTGSTAPARPGLRHQQVCSSRSLQTPRLSLHSQGQLRPRGAVALQAR